MPLGPAHQELKIRGAVWSRAQDYEIQCSGIVLVIERRAPGAPPRGDLSCVGTQAGLPACAEDHESTGP